MICSPAQPIKNPPKGFPVNEGDHTWSPPENWVLSIFKYIPGDNTESHVSFSLSLIAWLQKIWTCQNTNSFFVHVPETLAVKTIQGLAAWMSSFGKWKMDVIPLGWSSCHTHLSISTGKLWISRNNPRWPLSLRWSSYFPFTPSRGPSWRGFGIYWPKVALPFTSSGKVMHGVDFHTAPSVPLHTGVKFEHFVNPLGVEGDVNKERRLRGGTLCPLDAHADDDFALVLLAHQWPTVVFLQEEWAKCQLQWVKKHFIKSFF